MSDAESLSTPDSTQQDVEDWLRLGLTLHLGPASQRKLLSAFGSPQAVLSASHHAAARVVGETAAAALRAGTGSPAVAQLDEVDRSTG